MRYGTTPFTTKKFEMINNEFSFNQQRKYHEKEFTLALRLVDKFFDEDGAFTLTFNTSALGNKKEQSVQEQNKTYFKFDPSEYSQIITCGVYVRDKATFEYVINGSMHIQYDRRSEEVKIVSQNLPEGKNKLEVVRVDKTTFDLVLS
ncbi:hypothetical protein JZM24_11745 [Candidatus Sodalis endolongispinus]|uniref:Calcium-dependent cell adhesion molecule 1 membrane-binding domain-containing protein n=1 Tax=Candidatus Sodalis endolongispinus TaxID=2812662 RepID=A0ABS5YDD8_9GAMM|nr:hypothetical protein [Candidatus Sodalis endolongispinus]MBT9432629.1 hypothetical protein [Candidatus Sodalis endolongispinus]